MKLVSNVVRDITSAPERKPVKKSVRISFCLLSPALPYLSLLMLSGRDLQERVC